MISLRILFVVIVLIEIGLAGKTQPTQPPQPPRPESPLASDFWVVGARRPLRRAKRSMEEHFDNGYIFEHLTCIQNTIDQIVTKYQCNDIWENHRPEFVTAFNTFNRCVGLPEVQIRLCQFEHFYLANLAVSQFYDALVENSKQKVYEDIYSIVDDECKPDYLKARKLH